jgi:hypothetical protein
MLSEGLGKEVHTLCYPQGAMDDVVEGLAREAGYRMWTMSSWRRSRANRAPRERDVSGGAGADADARRPERIYRCGRGYELFGEGRSIATQVLSQRVVLARFSGNPWAHLATGLFSRISRLLPAAR